MEAGGPHLQLGPEGDQALGPGLDAGAVGPLRRHPGRAHGLVVVEGGEQGLELGHPGGLLGDAVDGAVALGPDVVDLGRHPAGVGPGGGGGGVELAVAGGGGRRLGPAPGGGGGCGAGGVGGLAQAGLGRGRGPGQLHRPGAGLVEGGPGDARGADAQPPADGRDAIAGPGDRDHVGEGEGDVDRLLPSPVDHDHVGQQVAEEPLHAGVARPDHRAQRAGRAVGRDGWGRVEEGAEGQDSGRQRARPGQVVEQPPAGRRPRRPPPPPPPRPPPPRRRPRSRTRRRPGRPGCPPRRRRPPTGRCRPDRWPRRRPWPGRRPGRPTCGGRRWPHGPRPRR